MLENNLAGLVMSPLISECRNLILEVLVKNDGTKGPENTV